MSTGLAAVDDPLAVAVIGMGLRVPGAGDIDTFRDNLASGRVLIEHFEPPAAMGRPAGGERLVGAEGVLAGIEDFDPGHFGLSQGEASIIDPQHRVLLECAWHALEHAGHRPRSVPGPGGVCVGAGLSSYLVRNLLGNQEIVDSFGGFGLLTRNDKDYASALLAHRLDLRGPAHGVASGCSSSLLAVHTAVTWLITGQCALALAGGVSLQVPQRQGTAPAGGIYSPTGRCRPFDADADGTVGGSGAGLVVLRRLADAVRDGDYIWAVIRGSATNSAGAERASFTAPSITAQVEVITDALQAAGLQPGDIGMVEAHGTGTSLGDLIELTALREALSGTEPMCWLGSVKAAVGHLDAAAGVVSLIKACVCVHDANIAPQPGFDRPHSDLPLAGSRFRVPTSAGPWPGPEPRRAGISSFGAGGSNVHVIIEQPPRRRGEPDPRSRRTEGSEPQTALEPCGLALVPVMAGSPAGLKSLIASSTTAIRAAAGGRGRSSARNIAHTLATAREPARFRSCLLLDGDGSVAGHTSLAEAKGPQIVFAFSGDGALTEGIAAELYRQDPAFSGALDACAQLISACTPGAPDVKALLTTTTGRPIQAPDLMQPVLFSLEYALASALIARDVRPAGLVGHSLGEVVAATLAGALTLPDAVHLVMARAATFSALPGGGMTAVAVAAEELTDDLLGTGPGAAAVSIAAVNGPQQTVLAGTPQALADFERRAGERGLIARRLPATRAYHSPALDGVLPGFADAIAGLPSRMPQLPMVSSLNGEWVDQPLGVEHWKRQMRAPVQFSTAVRNVCAGTDVMLVEVGPGCALAGLLRQQPELSGVPAVTLAGLPADPPSWTLAAGAGCLLRVAAELWAHGAAVVLTSTGDRVPAPLTPFERVRCWVEPDRATRPEDGVLEKIPTDRLDPDRWLTMPSWRRAGRRPARRPTGTSAHGPVLLLCHDDARGAELAGALAEPGRALVVVRSGPVAASESVTDHVVRPDVETDLLELVGGLPPGLTPDLVVHAWCLGGESSPADGPAEGPGAGADNALLDGLDARLELGLYSVLSLAKAVELANPGHPLRFVVLTQGAEDVLGGDLHRPDQAAALAAAKVIGREHGHWTVTGLDLGSGRHQPTGAAVAEEIGQGDQPRVALRGAHRWLPDLAPLAPDSGVSADAPLPGHYLVVGAFGAIGSTLTSWLAGPGAHLTLVTRHPTQDTGTEAVALVSSWLARGATVNIETADVADLAAMTAIRDRAERRYGEIDGVIHAAGEPDTGGVVLTRDRAGTKRHVAAKIRGALVLDRLFAEHPLRFMLFNASIASVLYRLKFGEVGYVAGSDVLLALAQYRTGRRPGLTRAVAWTDWRESGMWFTAQRTLREHYEAGALPGFGADGGNPLEHDVLQGLSPSEGLQVVSRVLHGSEPVTLVSTVDLRGLLAAHEEFDSFSHGKLLDDIGLRRRAAIPAGRMPAADPAGASGSVATVVSASWTALLGPSTDPGADDFFARGGDSLLALRFCARLREELGIDYPLSRLFANSSLVACIGDVTAMVGDGR